jgi:hypothetical protein
VEGLAGFDSIPVERWKGHRWFVGLPVFGRHPSTMCCLFHEQPNGSDIHRAMRVHLAESSVNPGHYPDSELRAA